MRLLKRANITVPSAFSVQPSGRFDEEDGQWSTFNLEVGNGSSGGQNFRAIVSTSSLSTWLPSPEACGQLTGKKFYFPPSNCPSFRGVGNYGGAQSQGYQGNNSDSVGSQATSASEIIGVSGGVSLADLYGLPFGNISGNLWRDYIHLTTSTAPSTSYVSTIRDPIYSYNDLYYNLPTFGIAAGLLQTTSGLTLNSTLTNLANGLTIPSRSWGYTAGASYDNSRLGSLVLGGYDQQRINGTTAAYNMTGSGQLKVTVTSIGMNYNNGSGPASSPGPAFDAILDSTLPYLFLPSATVDWMVQRMHLFAAPQSGNLYFNLGSTDMEVNKTRANIDYFSIAITTPSQALRSDANTKSIRLPYAALEGAASYEWNFTVRENPMLLVRRAPGNTAILGRAFFQEAYVSAEYEHNTFNVSQAARDTTGGANIVPILSDYWLKQIGAPTSTNSTGATTAKSSNGLSGGAIAGIVIGSIAGVLLILAALFFFVWRPRKKRNQEQKHREEKEAELAAESTAAAAAAAAAPKTPLSPELDAGKGSFRQSHLSTQSDGTVSEMGAGAPRNVRRASEMSTDSEVTAVGAGATPRAQHAGLTTLHEKQPAAEMWVDPVEMEGEGHMLGQSRGPLTPHQRPGAGLADPISPGPQMSPAALTPHHEGVSPGGHFSPAGGAVSPAGTTSPGRVSPAGDESPALGTPPPHAHEVSLGYGSALSPTSHPRN